VGDPVADQRAAAAGRRAGPPEDPAVGPDVGCEVHEPGVIRLAVDGLARPVDPEVALRADGVALALAGDVDALIRRLDLALCYGTLSPRQFQAIKESVERVTSGYWDWANERVYMAVYDVVTSPEFCVMR